MQIKRVLLLLFTFSLYFQNILSQCGNGCMKCIQNGIQSKQVCTKCYDNYSLDLNGICVYQLCNNDLYFQQLVVGSGENSQESCVSICNDMYFQDQESRTCSPLVQCSQVFTTSNVVIQQSMLQIIGQYLDYLITVYAGVVSLIGKDRGQLLQQYILSADDIQVFLYHQQVYVITVDQTMEIWNLLDNSRTIVLSNLVGNLVQKSNIVEINDKLGCLSILDDDLLTLQLIPFYLVSSGELMMNSKQFQMSLPPEKWKDMNKGIYMSQFGTIVSLIITQLYQNNTQINGMNSKQIYQCEINQSQNIGSIINIIELSNNQDTLLFSLITTSSLILIQIDLSNASCSILSSQLMTSYFAQSIYSDTNGNTFLICLSSSALDIYSIHSTLTKTQSILPDINYSFFSIQIGNWFISPSQQSLFILTNPIIGDSSYSQLITFNFNLSSKLFEIQPNKYNAFITNPTSVFGVYVDQSKVIDFLVLYNGDFEIISMNSSKEYNKFILSDFSSLYPKSFSRGQVNTMIILYNNNIMASCSNLGVLSFWDISSGYLGKLITEIKIENDNCFKLYKINEYLIAAFMTTDIQIVSLDTFSIINKFSHNSPNPSQILVSGDLNNFLLIINQCLVIYDSSSSFAIVFQNCIDQLITQATEIQLADNLIIFVIEESQIGSYSLSLNSQITPQQVIPLSNNVISSSIIMQQLSGSKSLDEILIVTSNFSFLIYDSTLTQIYIHNNLPIQAVLSMQRAQNDVDTYYILGTATLTPNNWMIINKKSQGQYVYQPHTKMASSLPPQKVILNDGNTYYHVQTLYVSPRFSGYFRYLVDPVNQITNRWGYDLVPLYQQSYDIMSSDNTKDYIGTIQGFVGVNIKSPLRYQELVLNLLNQNEVYQDIKQSLVMNLYFIVSNYKIIVLNVHTDEVILPNLFYSSNQNILSLSVFDSIQAIVCRRSNSLQIQYFGSTFSKKSFSYSGMNLISNFTISQDSSQFIVFGSSLVILDQSFNIKGQFGNNVNGIFQRCIVINDLLYCKINTGIVSIISLTTLQEVSSFLINAKQPQFDICIDKENNSIFLYNVNINVYDLNMNFQTSIINLFGQILTCNFFDIYLVFFTPTTGLVYTRNNLQAQKRIQDLGGMTILKYVFFKEMNSLILFGDQISIAQIFVYDFIQQSVIGKITGSVYVSPIGYPKDVMYDKGLNFVSFVDTQANYFMFDFNDPYAIQGMFIFKEIVARNEIIQLFSVNLISNRSFVMTQKSIFMVNYNIFSNRCQYFFMEPNHYFSMIFNKSSQQNEYLVLSSNSVVHRYSNFIISYEIALDQSNIIDFMYLQDLDIMVIATSTQLFLYQNYTISKDQKIEQSSPILFLKFLDVNIILTLDKSIIVYDYLGNTISYQFTILQHEMMTAFLQPNSSVINTNHQSYLIIGTNIGQVYILNMQQLKLSVLQSKSISSVQFIQLLQDNTTLIIGIVAGQIMNIDLSNGCVVSQDYDLLQIIGRESEKGTSVLSSLKIDVQYKRMMFHFLFEKKLYILQTVSNSLIGYLSFAHNEFNQIFIGKSFYYLQSAFQINIYSRQSLLYQTYIKRNTYYDQMIAFYIFTDQFLGLFFSQKFEIYFYDPITNNVQLVDQQACVYPKLMSFSFYSSSDQNPKTNNDMLQIIGYSQSNIFDLRYSTSYYLNQNSQNSGSLTQCGFTLQTADFLLLNSELNSLQIKKQEGYFQYGTTVINTPKWQNFLFLTIQQNLFSFLNSQNASLNQFVLSSPSNNSSQKSSGNYQVISLTEPLFLSFQGLEIQMKDVSFQFDQSQQSLNVTFNKQTDTIILSNVQINTQNIQGKSIVFSQMNKVIIENLQIVGVNMNNARILQAQKEAQSQGNLLSAASLLIFDQIQEVSIYHFTIANNTLSSQSILQSLLSFHSVQQINIQQLKISNNEFNGNVINIEIANQLVISDVEAIQNKNSNPNLSMSIFSITGCLQTSLSNIDFIDNTSIQLITTNNQFYLLNEIIQLSTDTLSLTQLNVRYNSIDYLTSSLISLQSSIITISKVVYYSNYGQILIVSTSSISITSSQFSNNSSLHGGALSIINVSNMVSISSSTFIGNQAFGCGGAIYIFSIQCALSFSKDVLIEENTAVIGGGIRIMNYDSNLIDLDEILEHCKILNNKAELFGHNIVSQLTRIEIVAFNQQELIQQNKFLVQFYPKNSTNTEDQLILSNFQSGGVLKLKVQLFDQTGRVLTIYKDKVTANKYPQDIINEINQITIELTSSNLQTTEISGESILNYNKFNEISNSFEYKEVILYGNPKTFHQLTMQVQISSTILKKVNVEVDFRFCVRGEIIIQFSSQIYLCQFCSSGTYSLQDPSTQSFYNISNTSSSQQIQNNTHIQMQCKQCPATCQSCEGHSLKIRNGYWRSDEDSEEILLCDSQINSCLPDDRKSIKGCKEGYMGPLCEVCDCTGHIWGQQYTVKQFTKSECQKCSSLAFQFVFLILKLIIPIFYFFFTARTFLNSYVHAQSCQYIRALKLLPISKSQIRDESGFFLKILVSYLQYSSLLVNSFSYIPIQINLLPQFVGSSLSQFIVGIECILPISLIEQLGRIRLLCFLQTLVPLLLIFICIVMKLLQKLMMKDNKLKYDFYIILIINFMFFQPEVVSQFVSILTCRSVGSQQLFLQDLMTNCYDENARIFVNYYAIINLTFWILVPLVIFYNFQQKKKNLSYCLTHYKYGYFYMDLKPKFYYWEFIRIYFKVTIITLFTLQKQNSYNIAILQVFIAFAIYLKQIYIHQPFISKRLSEVEILSLECVLVKLCIQDISLSVNLQQFEIPILIIDYVFIGYLFLIILYFKMNNRFSAFGLITRKLLKKLVKDSIFIKLTRASQLSFQTLLRWKKVQRNLPNIIGQKANANIIYANNRPNMNMIHTSSFLTKPLKMDRFESTEFTPTIILQPVQYDQTLQEQEGANRHLQTFQDITESIDLRSKSIFDEYPFITIPKFYDMSQTIQKLKSSQQKRNIEENLNIDDNIIQ